MNEMPKSELAKLPSVDRLLNAEGASEIIDRYGRAEVTRAVRAALSELRQALQKGGGR